MLLKRLSVSLVLTWILSPMLSGYAYAQTPRLQMQAVPSPASRTQNLEGHWNIRLQQNRFQDEFNQKTTTDFRVRTDLKYKPVENIGFHLVPQFTYTTGFIQTEEISKPSQSEWGVQEAAVDAALLPWTLISVGALDQGQDHPALLLHDQAFPALRLRIQSPDSGFVSTGAHLETAIPTSSSLSTQTQEFEKTPTFNSASLYLSVQKTRIEGRLRAGAYQFQNLPISVATASTYLGNTTVSSTGGSDSQFRYEYRGPFAQASLKAHLNRSLRLTAAGEWAQNSQAADGLNQALRSEIGAEIDAFKSYQIKPFYEFFRIEPDAVVAQYDGSWLNTNRIGYQGGLEISYRQLLKITFLGGERDVVYTTPFQQRERTWNLKLETFDVAI